MNSLGCVPIDADAFPEPCKGLAIAMKPDAAFLIEGTSMAQVSQNLCKVRV